MEAFVSKLMEYDRQAGQLLEDARAYAAKKDEETEREKGRMLAAFMAKEQEHLHAVQLSEQQLTEQTGDETAATLKQLRDAMESRYLQNRQQWRDELLRRCTEGD